MITSDTPNTPGAPSQAQQSATPSAAQPARRYQIFFGGALAVVTLVALVVAYASSDFRQSGASAIPATWKQVYSADITDASGDTWNGTKACSLDATGLDATGASTTDTLCVFQPGMQNPATSSGFYFATTIAPAAKVSAFARSIVSIGDVSDGGTPSSGPVVYFIVGQDGSYLLCDNDCVSTRSDIYLRGGLAAWHGNALLANTIAMKVSPDHSTLTVYVNGQEVATVTPHLGPQPAIAVGAAAGSETIFTHATLYTGQ